MIFFVDDVNLPTKEIYGAQPPIEMLRQFEDFKGFYDRKKLFWKDVEDTVLCAACAPPGGGRESLTQRFTRHFALFSVPVPGRQSMFSIMSKLLRGHLNGTQLPDGDLLESVIQCCIDVYTR